MKYHHLIGEKNTGEKIVLGIVFFVEFIMILIFCEIIELDFFELKKNTWKNIVKRAALEQFEIGEENNNQIEQVELSGGLILNLDCRSQSSNNENNY